MTFTLSDAQRRTEGSAVDDGGPAIPNWLVSRLAQVEPVAFGLLALLAVVCGLLSLTWPPGFDHGLYAWTADVVLRGGVMYRDAWDMHGPLVPYLFALPQWLARHEFWPVRLMDLALVTAAAFAMYRLVRRLSGRGTARWAALLFTLFYLSLGFNDIAQPDGWVSLAILIVVERITRHHGVPPARELLLFGVVAGLGVLVKPLFVVYGLLPVIYVLAATRSPRAVLTTTILLGASGAAPLLLMAAWMASVGGLEALIEVHLRYTSEVYAWDSGTVLYTRLLGPVVFFGAFPIVVVAVPAALAGTFVILRHRQHAALVLAWLLMALGIVMLQDKFWRYQWMTTIPALTVLAAMGFARTFEEFRSIASQPPGAAEGTRRSQPGVSGGAVIGLALLIVVVLHSAVVPGRYALRGARMLTGVWDHDRYHSTFTAGGFERWDHVLAARWIEENTPQDAQIALYTNTSLIAWLSRRETPFRLAGWRFPMHEAAGSSPWQRYRDEYMSDLRRTRPDVIVVQTRAGQSGLPLDEMRLLVEFPELRDFLETHYHRAHVLSTLAVFRKIPPAGGNGVEPGPSAPTGLSAASPRRAPG